MSNEPRSHPKPGNQPWIKKCVVGSTTIHILLLLAFFLLPAFFSPEVKKQDAPILNIVDATLVDRVLQTPAPQQPRKQTPRPTPPKKISPTPPAPKPKPVPRETTPPIKTTPKRPKIKISTSRSQTKPAVNRANNEVRQQKINQLTRSLSNSTKALNANLSPVTSVIDNAPNARAFTNYRSLVKQAFERVWIEPSDLNDNRAAVKVEVIIARNGTVMSKKIVARSRHSSLNTSVQAALDRVSKIQPFPPGTKDQKRTFTINFSLR
jgi:TonB family protein